VKENIQVLIYSSSLCGYCYQAKTLLKKKNISFQEIDVDEDFNKRKEMIAKSNGRTSVPQIFFGDTHIGGCDDLINLDRIGKLEVEDE
jgi:glutaredoxin 3|tara:strand:- start:2819 stop:3082 length:264 start_codon:yes stop_codon:yes gene_type:complete